MTVSVEETHSGWGLAFLVEFFQEILVHAVEVVECGEMCGDSFVFELLVPRVRSDATDTY